MKNKEFVDSKKENDELSGGSIRDFFNGSLLTRGIILKNVGFIVWLTFLGFLYIGNSYHADNVARTISRLQREVRELRSESITTANDLMRARRLSEVQKLVKNNRLTVKESTEPPYKIKK